MNIVTVDGPVRTGMTKRIEISQVRDADGNVLGYFVPEGMPQGPEYLRMILSIDRDRIEEIKKTPGKGVTTSELLAWLGTLASSEECATR